MIESGGTAPYAPTGAVLDVIHAYREKPVQTPITTEVIEKIGVSGTIAPRTLQALKILDLLDGEGQPTLALNDLRKAGADEYQIRLAEVIRAAYQDVFTYRDPANDDAEKIADAFRSYKPVGMRDRMVRLFLGLCAEAGIIADVPRVPNAPATRSPGRLVHGSQSPQSPRPERAKLVSATAVSEPRVREGRPTALPRASITTAGSDHLVIRGLLQTLPPIGSVFPEEKRREWADAVLAAFALIYEREPKKPTSGGDDGA